MRPFIIPGPRERGGEFIHKSFREYLFAEAIVEGVKRIAPGGQRLPRRTPYWKDFDESDPRSAAVEELGRLLGPQWLMQDVAKHVRWLIAWEIRRAQTASTDWQERDETQPIDIRAWAVVRDVLADLWDWWGEGVHLRAQPQRERGGQSISFIEPYAVRLSKEITPTDLPRGVMPEPVRVATLDAHLGDALFRLNCAVHFEINRVTGWLARPTNGVNALSSALWEDSSWDEATDHPYQTKIGEGQGTWVAFAPAGRANSIYFRLYCHRINSAGWRPGGFFPSSVDMSGVDFAGSNLALSVLGGSSFQYARLSKAFVGSAYLEDCDFGNCAADGLQLIDATINNSDFSGADLRQANFRAARVCASRLATACVEQLKCTHALFVDIDRSDLAGADTSLAQFAKSPYSRFDSPESSSQPTS